jgi:CheY-like chemotaxis protein
MEFNILLVDDDDSLLDLYELKLKKSIGISNIKKAMDGQEALELLKTHHFDLIISDVCMPKYDGISLCREAKGHFPNLPVFLLSSKLTLTPKEIIDINADLFVLKSKFDKLIPVSILKLQILKLEAAA